MRALIVPLMFTLGGCASLGNISTTNLAQSKPLPMYTLDCEGYVVFSGLPIPLGVRMPELDTLCKSKQSVQSTGGTK